MLVSRKKLDSFDWKDLKGKTILSWRIGSMPALFLERILRSNGIDPHKDVNIITNLAAPARHGAFVAGTGDFATFFEPDVAILEKNGVGHYVTSIGKAVGDVDYTVFMATRSYIAKNPNVVQGWTNAIYKAQKYSFEADPAVIAKEIAPFFPQVDSEIIARSVIRYRSPGLLKRNPLVEPGPISVLQDLQVEGGILKGERVAFEEIVDTEFAKKAMEK
jgi:NitT/TauT family transport system substrate-binding protein